jgi:hypothetical protein
MKKLITVLFAGAVVFSTLSLVANVDIFKKHKDLNGAVKIKSCNDCHNATTKLEKKKGQNYKALWKTRSCTGKGCHI